MIPVPTKLEYDRVLKELNEKGIMFKIEDNYWDSYKDITCICIDWLSLSYCDRNYFEGKPTEYIIVTLEEWNERVNGVTIRIDKWEVWWDNTVETTWKWNTIVKSKVIKQTLTYETIIRRSDWIEFKKDTIDWETIEQIKKRISIYRTEENKLQWLLKFHSNHF